MNDILENQQQDILISQEERSKDRAAVSQFKEERRRKRTACLGLLKGRARKAKDASSGHDPAKKGKGKGEMKNPTSLRQFC